MQWDISYNVDTLAKIDISQDHFNYKEHLKNALTLSGFLNLSIIIGFLFMYPYYRPNIWITLIFIIPTMIDFIVVPFYTLKKNYLQLHYSALKTTVVVQTANGMRTLCSFLKTPYCTLFGQ